jgi:3-mercaptopyruvate sulfurtransferase SseA
VHDPAGRRKLRWAVLQLALASNLIRALNHAVDKETRAPPLPANALHSPELWKLIARDSLQLLVPICYSVSTPSAAHCARSLLRLALVPLQQAELPCPNTASRRTLSTQLSSIQLSSKLSTAPKIVPLCASWFLPNDGRNGKETFLAERIPRAQFFDLDAVKDPDSPYPHMLPSAEDFAAAMGKLGIRRHDSVVVYDSKELGIFSAPRVGWTLQAFGHPNVHVLNNFRRWVEEGYPTESGEPKSVDAVDYPVPELDKSKVVAFEEVREIAKEQGLEGAEEVQILDARSLGRWKGIDPEPRAGEH